MFNDRPQRSSAADSMKSTHGQVNPGDVLVGSDLSATLYRKGAKEALGGFALWHVSPFGIEMLQKEGDELDSGALLEIRLRTKHQELVYAGQVTGLQQVEKKGILVGIRFLKSERPADSDSRKVTRWDCDPMYQPTGLSPNPLRFNDHVYFCVKNISSSGMLVVTSMRNKHLFPGVKLKARITFPCVGEGQFHLTVSHARETIVDAKPYLAVGVIFEKTSAADLVLCGQYLLQFCTFEGKAPNLSELRAQGMLVASSAKSVDYCYVRTKEEYEEVLTLRQKAFRATLADKTFDSLANWSDLYDGRARILMGRHRGRVVTTSRVVFHSQDDKSEHDSLVQMPSTMPPKEQIVEVGRLCNDPDYRKSDLFVSLMSYIILTVIQAGRRYTLNNCTDELLPIYKRAGCMPTGLTFKHVRDGKRHHVLLADLRRVIFGLDLSLKMWSVLVFPLWDDLKDYCKDDRSLRESLTQKFYLLGCRATESLKASVIVPLEKRKQQKKQD